MIKAILFDLDGTIIDSEPIAFKAILECARGWGVPVAPEDAAQVAGKKWEVAFDLLYSKFTMPLPKGEASKQIIERYKEILKDELGTVPFVVDAIHKLSKEYRLALVSGSHRAEIIWALTKLNVIQHFEVILGAEDYAESKPAPDGYLKAIDMLGIDPGAALIFEDSQAGITSGKAAGAKVVGITSTNHFHFDQSASDVLIQDFKDVDCTWVKKQFNF